MQVVLGFTGSTCADNVKCGIACLDSGENIGSVDAKNCVCSCALDLFHRTLVPSEFHAHAQNAPTMASTLTLLSATIVCVSARKGLRAKHELDTLHAHKHAKTAACRKELLLEMAADALVAWVSPGRRVKRL